MDCLRCGHRMDERGAARGRQWHEKCPAVCEDPWCSHPAHGEQGKPAEIRHGEDPRPSAVPAEPPEEWLGKADLGGKPKAAALLDVCGLIERCEKVRREWGNAIVFQTEFGRVLFFIESEHQVALLEDAQGLFRLHGSLKRVVTILALEALRKRGEKEKE